MHIIRRGQLDQIWIKLTSEYKRKLGFVLRWPPGLLSSSSSATLDCAAWVLRTFPSPSIQNNAHQHQHIIIKSYLCQNYYIHSQTVAIRSLWIPDITSQSFNEGSMATPSSNCCWNFLNTIFSNDLIFVGDFVIHWLNDPQNKY